MSGEEKETEKKEVEKIEEGSEKVEKAEKKIDAWPEDAQAEIKRLREEAKSRRLENKKINDRLQKMEKGLKSAFGDESTDENPEEKIKRISEEREAINERIAILDICAEHGIAKKDRAYLRFQLQNAAEGLEEGEQITEEIMQDIVKEVKSRSKSEKKEANSSVKGPPKEGENAGNQAITKEDVENFKKMTIAEKTEVYDKSEARYEKLMKMAGIT